MVRAQPFRWVGEPVGTFLVTGLGRGRFVTAESDFGEPVTLHLVTDNAIVSSTEVAGWSLLAIIAHAYNNAGVGAFLAQEGD